MDPTAPRLVDAGDEVHQLTVRLLELVGSKTPGEEPVTILANALQAVTAPMRMDGMHPGLVTCAYAQALGSHLAICGAKHPQHVLEPFWRAVVHTYDLAVATLQGNGPGQVITGRRSTKGVH